MEHAIYLLNYILCLIYYKSRLIPLHIVSNEIVVVVREIIVQTFFFFTVAHFDLFVIAYYVVKIEMIYSFLDAIIISIFFYLLLLIVDVFKYFKTIWLKSFHAVFLRRRSKYLIKITIHSFTHLKIKMYVKPR